MQGKKCTTFFILMTVVLLFAIGCGKKDPMNGIKDDNSEQREENMDADQEIDKENEVTDTDLNEEEDDTEVITDDKHSEFIEIHDASYIKTSTMQKKILKQLKQEAVSTVYTKKYQAAADATLKAYQRKDKYTVEAPLLIMNPYGTLDQSMYLFFEVDQPCKVEYTLAVDNDAISERKGMILADEQCFIEGMILGLIPGEKNYLTLTQSNDSDELIMERVYCIDLEDEEAKEQLLYKNLNEVTKDDTLNGFFLLFGTKADKNASVTFIDGEGIKRSELKIDTTLSMDVVKVGDTICFPKDVNTIVQMDQYGHIIRFYPIKMYDYENSMIYDDQTHQIYLIASEKTRDTKGDILISLDLSDGSIQKRMDFAEMLPDLYTNRAEDKKKWMGIESIDLINSDQILINSKVLSSIFCISNLKEEARLSYIISEKALWKDTPYEELVYEAIGNFVPFAGQSNIDVFSEDKRLIDGQYYIIMYNHNYGAKNPYLSDDLSQVEDSQINGSEIKNQSTSSYYKIFVDENTKTFTLADRLDLEFVKHGGSIQLFGDNLIYYQQETKTFAQYNTEGELLNAYQIETDGVVRLIKMVDFSNFW